MSFAEAVVKLFKICGGVENVCEAREIETGYRAGAAKSEVVAWERVRLSPSPFSSQHLYLVTCTVTFIHMILTCPLKINYTLSLKCTLCELYL